MTSRDCCCALQILRHMLTEQYDHTVKAHRKSQEKMLFGSSWTEGGVVAKGIHKVSWTNSKQAVSKTQADSTGVFKMWKLFFRIILHDLENVNLDHITKQNINFVSVLVTCLFFMTLIIPELGLYHCGTYSQMMIIILKPHSSCKRSSNVDYYVFLMVNPWPNLTDNITMTRAKFHCRSFSFSFRCNRRLRSHKILHVRYWQRNKKVQSHSVTSIDVLLDHVNFCSLCHEKHCCLADKSQDSDVQVCQEHVNASHATVYSVGELLYW